jgi:hypothetical protein
VNPRPQNTRLGNESVICQKCHADNVIAVVKSANCGPDSECDLTPADELFSNIDPSQNPITGQGHVIEPLTEAIHWNHRNVSECEDPEDPESCGNIVFNDELGRDGGCQGCHPAHRSDGDMSGYPITLDGDNLYDGTHDGFPGDNRDANGGCFVGRDVHSNRMKDVDGAETPSHLNPVGKWLLDNVANDSDNWKGIWCTNCHSQAGQELWKAENVEDLIHAEPGAPGNVRQPNADHPYGGTLTEVVEAVNGALGSNYSVDLFESWLDPKNDPTDPTMFDPNDQTHAIWAPDPGICAHVASVLSDEISPDPAQDGNVATIEVAIGSTNGAECSTGIGLPGPDCFGTGDPSFFICGSLDGDGDVNVSLVTIGNTEEDGTGDPCVPGVVPQCFAQSSPFCTTSDCVGAAQDFLDVTNTNGSTNAFPVPMSAATDGRDHWLSPGEAHCADCHAAPYVEQSGNISNYPPFNYPRKASLMRYTRGHRDITCQGCHESIHGLYPVTPDIDTTSYAQAAQWNADSSHGPLKCGSCHEINRDGVNSKVKDLAYQGEPIKNNFDLAVGWAHTFTTEHDPRQDLCENCHGDNAAAVDCGTLQWLKHSSQGRVSRNVMDQVETLQLDEVCGSESAAVAMDTVCLGCHQQDRRDDVSCDRPKWKEHLTNGHVAQDVWEHVTVTQLDDGNPDTPPETCGW